MDALRSLDPATRAALLEHVARVKHDLGKYVAFQIRWVAPDAPLPDRRAALAADLLATRRGPEGATDAVTLWREVRAPLLGEQDLSNGSRVDLSRDASVLAIEDAMANIEDLLDCVRGSAATEAQVARGILAAVRVSDSCRELHRRVAGRRT